MKNFPLRIFSVICLISFSLNCLSQTKTEKEILLKAAVIQAQKEKDLHQRLEVLAKQKGWPMTLNGKKGGISSLVGIDSLGYPLYLSTNDNIISAATIRTNTLWPGGSTGLNLSGSSAIVKDKLAIWDGGRVRSTHVELTGRVVQRDNPSSIVDHSTHVAGTLIAAGVNPLAKGMSFGDQELVAYDFNNDASEMLNESPNLLVSNHSYGYNAGWVYNSTQSRWEYWGPFGSTEDYKFGYYSSEAQMWDSIAYNAPYYLIVQSAGNSRDENGPAVGQPYWRFDVNGVMSSAGNRPAGISNNDSYDILSLNANAKNTLLVGAVNPIPGGYNSPSDVVMSSFSSWGPTDDGRIKPDVVTDGVDVLSCIGTSDNAYDIYSGTSMAAPAASGSILLLQEYYARLHNNTFLRSATIRGLIIHTADEAGLYPGPDYQFGWGLINMQKAAAVITSNNTDQLIEENTLNNGATYTQNVVASGKGPLIVTICWTDPKGTVEAIASALDNPAKKLVNDLDVVVKIGSTTYYPWVLDPNNPSAAATTGDNNTDNVEKILVSDAIPGATYTIQVSHKGTLQRGSQAYSLIVSGVGGQAYCTSGPTSSQGARIDSVSFVGIHNKNVSGCTTYSNFTNLTADIQPSQTIPIYVKLNSCDATTVDKVVKVYIDFNNDGDFDDAGENVATSGVINGDGVFTANITTPGGLQKDFYSIMRIVTEETSTVSDVTPCGIYAKGETQDYRIHFAAPSTDVGINELIAPLPGSCSSGNQLVVVRIHNFGSTSQSNIPVTVLVQQASTTVLNLSTTYPGTVAGGSDVVYTFQTPFISAAGTTYTITTSTNLTGDQYTSNDTLVSTITTGATSADPTGTAEICGGSEVFLNTTGTSPDAFTWYDVSNATTPIASGTSTSSSVITSNQTYYLQKNDITLRLSPADKTVLSSGGYNAFSGNFVKFNNSVPLVIESAKLYIRSAGQITFTVADLASFSYASGSYSYYPISSTTIDAYPTSPNPASGAQNDDPSDQGAIFYLNLPVPTTGDHIIIVQCQNGANIYRNSSSTTLYSYPFGIPGIMAFTGNSAYNTADTTDQNYFKHYYYFFYNTSFQLSDCPSARVPVVATSTTAPVITQNGNVLSSTIATGNQWYLNGVPITGGTSQNFTATTSGLYTDVVTDSYGCALTSNQINFSVTAVTDPGNTTTGLFVSPNPTHGEFQIEFITTTKADLDISLINSLGQQVYHTSVPGFIGNYSKTIDPGNIASGIYYLKVQHDKKTYLKKIVITP